MATDSTSTTAGSGGDVLVSTVTALTASGAWVTWSGYRAASKTSGRPDYYICTLPRNSIDVKIPSGYDLVQIGAQAKTATVELTVIALGANATAQLTEPNGTVTPLPEGKTVSVPGSTTAGGASLLTFTGDSATLKVVHPSATTAGTTDATVMSGDDNGGPPPPYPGEGDSN